jgi:hypothetical protein
MFCAVTNSLPDTSLAAAAASSCHGEFQVKWDTVIIGHYSGETKVNHGKHQSAATDFKPWLLEYEEVLQIWPLKSLIGSSLSISRIKFCMHFSSLLSDVFRQTNSSRKKRIKKFFSVSFCPSCYVLLFPNTLTLQQVLVLSDVKSLISNETSQWTRCVRPDISVMYSMRGIIWIRVYITINTGYSAQRAFLIDSTPASSQYRKNCFNKIESLLWLK